MKWQPYLTNIWTRRLTSNLDKRTYSLLMNVNESSAYSRVEAHFYTNITNFRRWNRMHLVSYLTNSLQVRVTQSLFVLKAPPLVMKRGHLMMRMLT
jgi:hypothetical protein